MNMFKTLNMLTENNMHVCGVYNKIGTLWRIKEIQIQQILSYK